MLMKLIKAELIKLKRSPVWLGFAILPVIPALLGTLNYLYNIELLKSEWYSLWTQHTIFTAYIFLPLMIGIYCSYTMYMEEKQHNWNRLLSVPAKRSCIFLAKLCCVTLMILLSALWIGVLFVISGYITGLSQPPLESVFLWCAMGTLGGTVMAAIQLSLSLYIKGFALPVAISVAGGFSGLLFLAKDLGHIWPYSLMAYGMNSNSPQQLLATGYVRFIITCLLYVGICAAVGCKSMGRER